jgi:glycosyltransferase involved in cell wall biosynthesis
MMSIIIPTLNEEKYLPRLLQSIRKQSYKDYEIIVADSSSKDKTLSIARKHGCRTTVLKKGSPARGRNAGAKIAKGSLLVFMDADGLLIHEDFLEKLCRQFYERKLACCTCHYTILSDSLLIRSFYVILNSTQWVFQFIYPYACGYMIAATKEVHDRIEGYDETIHVGEDSDYTRKARKHGKFRILPITIGASSRRFEKEGVITYSLKGLAIFFYNIFFGKLKKPLYKYEFGKY